jgi:N-acetylglucosaminyldiphosphoundecaprenol N-acetyl-beta-D-mannosaminyltransferase
MGSHRLAGRVALFEFVWVGTLRIQSISARECVDAVFAALESGLGGQIVTPNLDILQLCDENAETSALFNSAGLRVADGVPLMWLARLAGTPLPARIAGSDLVWLLAERAAREQRSLYLLGGESGVAAKAARVLEERFAGLRVVGWSAPRVSASPTPQELTPILDELRRAVPDLVYCAFGSPKQELLSAALAPDLPRTWFLGCGAALSFIAGHRVRAPRWVQRIGFEWLYRMLEEPDRLVRRYLVRNLPYLLLRAAPRALLRRLTGGPADTSRDAQA